MYFSSLGRFLADKNVFSQFRQISLSGEGGRCVPNSAKVVCWVPMEDSVGGGSVVGGNCPDPASWGIPGPYFRRLPGDKCNRLFVFRAVKQL